jgi:hypothetical protein
LCVTVSRDEKDAQVANRLPKPLAALFEKFRSFQSIYPQIRLKVSVKGDPMLAGECYARYDTQLMSNPIKHTKAHKSKLFNPASGHPGDKVQQEPALKQTKEAKKPEAVEENEEGMISDAEAY